MRKNKEQGAVLVVSLIILMVMAGFGVAYLGMTSAQSKQISVSVDYQTAFQVSLAGFDMSRCYSLGKFIESSKSWDNELQGCVDNGNNTTPSDGVGLDEIITVGTITTSFKWATNIEYYGSTYLATITNNNDDGDATNDTDDLVILTVTSTHASGITVSQALNQGIPASVVQALVRYHPPVYEPDEAIVTGGSLSLGGNSSVSGTSGTIYASGDVDISGSAEVTQDIFSAGTITEYGVETGGGDPAPDVPSIDPSEYRHLADYILEPDGKVYEQIDGVKQLPEEGTADVGTSVLGWNYISSTLTWKNDGRPVTGTFYVEDGNIDLTGNIGSAGDPWQVTLLVMGSTTDTGKVDIKGTGNATIVPDEGGIAIMAYNDINITGNLTVQDGLVATHEQISIGGNVHVEGSILAEAATAGIFGIAVVGSGNCGVLYNGGLTTMLKQGDPAVRIMGFRRIR